VRLDETPWKDSLNRAKKRSEGSALGLEHLGCREMGKKSKKREVLFFETEQNPETLVSQEAKGEMFW
jgi:hypothetical protein